MYIHIYIYIYYFGGFIYIHIYICTQHDIWNRAVRRLYLVGSRDHSEISKTPTVSETHGWHMSGGHTKTNITIAIHIYIYVYIYIYIYTSPVCVLEVPCTFSAVEFWRNARSVAKIRKNGCMVGPRYIRALAVDDLVRVGSRQQPWRGGGQISLYFIFVC